jgi:hypothetical protein
MHNDGRSPSQNSKSTKRLSPSDIRRRETRKAERTALREAGQLVQKPSTFRYFVNRLKPHRAVFESPVAQQDLNREICTSPFEYATMEHSGGRLSVMAHSAQALAAELVEKGWILL